MSIITSHHLNKQFKIQLNAEYKNPLSIKCFSTKIIMRQNVLSQCWRGESLTTTAAQS